MLKKVVIFAFLGVLSTFGWQFLNRRPEILNKVTSTFSSREFRIFKARYTADEIIAQHRAELLKTKGSFLLEPEIVYSPLLLMEVKYTPKNKNRTHEASLLWDLVSGEMITDTTSWKTTHGFEECLIAKTSAEEFKILKEIIHEGNEMEKKLLYQKLDAEIDVETQIEECIRKKLIVEEGERLRLHFENPQFETEPKTATNEYVHIIPSKPKQVASRNYSPSQVEKFLHVAFGGHFAIKRSDEVYVPVYEICVEHPDGSLLKSYWNALNSARMADKKG